MRSIGRSGAYSVINRDGVASAGRPRSYVGEQRVADLLGERQQFLAPAFAAQADAALPPVDIVEAEPRHLARPKPEPDQRQDDGSVAQAPLPVARTDDPRDIGIRQEARDRCQPPSRNIRHGVVEPRRTSSCRDQEAQERADADRYALHALDRYGLRTFDHVCPDRHGVVGRRDIPQRIDEGSNRPKIRGERRFSQAAAARGPKPQTPPPVAPPISSAIASSRPDPQGRR